MSEYVRSWKPKPITIHEKANFGKKWTSDLAWARVLYKPKTDKIIFIKTWKQCSKNNKTWIQPYFPQESYDKLLSYARKRYLENYARSSKNDKSKLNKLKGHCSELCEMCLEKRKLYSDISLSCNDSKNNTNIMINKFLDT